MTTKEVLIAARKLIEKPENWCKGLFYTSANGGSYCAAGACKKVRHAEAESQAATDALNRALGHAPGGLTGFNDTHTHAEVLDLFDRAIAAEPA